MQGRSALDYFAKLKDPLRASPKLMLGHPAAPTSQYASLAAARAAVGDQIYVPALLMATAQRLRDATLNLATDTDAGYMHKFAEGQVKLPLWKDYTSSLATATARYGREWHGRLDPLFLLSTNAFSNGQSPAWSDVQNELHQHRIPTQPNDPQNVATPELNQIGINMSELIKQHQIFEEHMKHAKLYSEAIKTGLAITKWNDEGAILAAVEAHWSDEDHGLSILIPEMKDKDPQSDDYEIAENFLKAAKTLHDLKSQRTPDPNTLITQKNKYELLLATLDTKIPD